ncbi:MAG: EAL domain-containing protein, partial [Alphaproteobacteria bacterium]|nr:EAL domain-containing protein [Alphaproteobacteria bacterium]
HNAQALETQANDLDNLLNSTDVATLFLGADLCIRWYTPAMTQLMPLRPWDLGRHAEHLAPQFSGRDLAADAARVLQTLEPQVTEVRGSDGRWHVRRIVPYRTTDAHIAGVAVTFADITERKRSEDEIIHQATHDALTDLPNRAAFHRELALARERAAARSSKLAVLMLDLDRFKRVNDSYGHAVGDQLLIETARRLRHCVRDHDLVARLGGDEFAILIPDADDKVTTCARRILRRLAEPCRCGAIELRPRASIGITVFPDDGGDGDQLLGHADRALYVAKESRQRGWAFFDGDMRLADELPGAIERDEFELDYQPIVGLAGGAVFGAEALLRWNHPNCGRLLPKRFLPLAERQGLMPAITRWVLDHACRQLAAWQDEGISPGKLTVNVTDEFLLQADIVPVVEDLLRRHGTAPGDLVLEIHERTLLESADDALLPVLERLRALGFGIALDDFGVGYASLIRLRLAPVGIVKIDREFLRDQGASPDNMTIIAAMVDLCRRLDKTIIVEGIETKAQRMRVMAAGCAWGQGYWHARPMNAEAMTERLLNHATQPTADRGTRRPAIASQ